ncbi:hypothetical protein FRC17_003553 [Serendipita sp. 399]|nr:hypothetical protein FRC17_003553 [Serendipita sp. 399]
MSEEQKEWRRNLAERKDIINSKIESIIDNLVKALSENKIQVAEGPTSNGQAQKVEIAIQTEEDVNSGTASDAVVPSVNSLSNGIASMEVVRSPPQDPVSTPQTAAPDVESLRSHLARLVAQMTKQESVIRSLEISLVVLRRDNDVLLKELETKSVEIRQHEALQYTQRSRTNGLISELEKAGNEVERLRASIESFHKPSSIVYQSIKDAVQRELRGDPPLNPAFRVNSATASANEVEGRPTKRPRIDGSRSNSASRPHSPNNTNQIARPQLSFETGHPAQNARPNASPTMQAIAGDPSREPTHMNIQGQTRVSPGASSSLKRPREEIVTPRDQINPLHLPQQAIFHPLPQRSQESVNGVQGQHQRPGHRQHRSWSVDGAVNKETPSQARTGEPSQQSQTPLILYRLEPPGPGNPHPIAIPMYSMPVEAAVNHDSVQPSVRPRTFSSAAKQLPNFAPRPTQYEYAQPPPNQSLSTPIATGRPGEYPITRENMRPPPVTSASTPGTMPAQPTTTPLFHPYSMLQQPHNPRIAPSSVALRPYPPNVSQSPVMQQMPVSSGNARSLLTVDNPDPATQTSVEQTRLIPYLLTDPHALKLAGKLYDFGREGQTTLIRCNVCGLSGSLSSDFKSAFNHSMTQHLELFDTAYDATYRELMASAQRGSSAASATPTQAT